MKSLYGDWTQIIELLDEEMSYAFDTGDISRLDPLFDFNISDLLEIMYLENAPTKVRRSVMMFLESEWQRFSPTQIEELRLALNTIFLDTRYDELDVQFLIIELLAKYYHDARSLHTLIHFAQKYDWSAQSPGLRRSWDVRDEDFGREQKERSHSPS